MIRSRFCAECLPHPALLTRQSHPNVDKKLMSTDSIIALKAADKPFPVGTELGVLKWRFQTTDEASIPLTSMPACPAGCRSLMSTDFCTQSMSSHKQKGTQGASLRLAHAQSTAGRT
jgi:hypothetical protein